MSLRNSTLVCGWLRNAPSIDEVMAAIGDPSAYDEVVFCGYGEPLLRLELVKEVARLGGNISDKAKPRILRFSVWNKSMKV